MAPQERGCGRRTALGEYIAPPGGKPLTTLARPLPGPADYSLPNMNLHKLTAPHYTVRIKYVDKTNSQASWPCSNTYSANSSACKHPLLTTLKPLVEPPDYRCSPGPVHLVRTGNMDRQPGKTSLKGRHSPQAITGHPSPLDRTCHTQTPAPLYSPVTAQLPTAPRFRFNSPPVRRDQTAGPGPGKRNLERSASGPSYTMRKRPQQLTFSMDNPPPDWYFVKDVLPAVHASKIGERIPERTSSPAPAPNAYKVPKRPQCAPEMTFRPFDNEPTFQTPGPGTYSPEVAPKRRAPAYSLRLPVPAAYPSQERASFGQGPAQYNTRRQPVTRPAFQLTRRPVSQHESYPAPNAYKPHEAPGTKHGYTLGIKPNDFKRPKAPASNKYLPSKPLPQAPKYSLRIRHRDMTHKEHEQVPSPDTYRPKIDCGCGVYLKTTPGVSLKSRPSMYVFTGYDRARLPAAGMSPEADHVRKPFV